MTVILEMQDGMKMANPSQEQVREALRRLNGGRVRHWKARKPGAPGGETRHLLIGGVSSL